MKFLESDRIDWIDIAKGIAIILVILGHTVGFDTTIESIIRGVIFSFHMPLFFILSCVTFRLSINNDQFVKKTEKAFKHLIVPAVVLYGLRVAINIVCHYSTIEWKSYVIEKINVLVYGSGVNVDVMGISIPAMGMFWFLIVLFLGRSFFDYLHLKLTNKSFVVVIVICTLLGIAFGKFQWLPFSFDLALAVMPFFYFGNYLKSIDMKQKTVLFGSVSFIIWVGTLIMCYIVKKNYMELACRRYILFPVCYITAIAATMFVGYFSVIVSELKIMKPIIYIGRNSMYMLWVHIMDYVVQFVWNRTGNSYINAMLRITIDTVLFLILMQFINLLKKSK